MSASTSALRSSRCAPDPTAITRAGALASRRSSSRRVSKNAPRKFCAKPRSAPSGVRAPAGCKPPALWISTSIPWPRSSTASASAATSAASPMSARRNCAEPPAPRTASAAAMPRAWLWPTIRISAPSRASPIAAKCPIPREAPVNSTVLPCMLQPTAEFSVLLDRVTARWRSTSGTGSGPWVYGDLRNAADLYATAQPEGGTPGRKRRCFFHVLGCDHGVAAQAGAVAEVAQGPGGEHPVPGVDLAGAKTLEPRLPRLCGFRPGLVVRGHPVREHECRHCRLLGFRLTRRRLLYWWMPGSRESGHAVPGFRGSRRLYR